MSAPTAHLKQFAFSAERNRDPEWRAKQKAGHDARRLRLKTQLTLTTFEGSKAIQLPGLSEKLNVKEICARATPGTLIEVLKLMRTAKAEETRLSAARLILAYAWGEPEKNVNTNRDGERGAMNANLTVVLASPIPDGRGATVEGKCTPSSGPASRGAVAGPEPLDIIPDK